MAWLDDRIKDHPKFVDLSDRAFREWVHALCYCSMHGTNGRLDAAIKALRIPKTVTRELVRAGVWDEENDGLWVHDWQEHNDRRDTALELKKEQARERQKRHRDKVRALRVTRDSHANVTPDERDKSVTVTRGGAPAPTRAPAGACPPPARDHDHDHDHEEPRTESSSLHADAARRQTALAALDDDDLEKALEELRPNRAQAARILRAATEEPERLKACLREALARGHRVEPYLDQALVNGSWPQPIPDPATLAAGQTIEIALAWQRYVQGYDWDDTFTDNDMLAELERIRASNRVSGYLADRDALEAWETERGRRYDPEPELRDSTTSERAATVTQK